MQIQRTIQRRLRRKYLQEGIDIGVLCATMNELNHKEKHMQNRKEIVEYSLDAFVRSIEQGFIQGYKLDFDSNENYPLALGPSMFMCGMIPRNETKPVDLVIKVDAQDAVEAIQQVQLELNLEGAMQDEPQDEPQDKADVVPEAEPVVEPKAKPRRVLKK